MAKTKLTSGGMFCSRALAQAHARGFRNRGPNSLCPLHPHCCPAVNTSLQELQLRQDLISTFIFQRIFRITLLFCFKSSCDVYFSDAENDLSFPSPFLVCVESAQMPCRDLQRMLLEVHLAAGGHVNEDRPFFQTTVQCQLRKIRLVGTGVV